jgi:uncharacterized protein (TIGR02996 family)
MLTAVVENLLDDRPKLLYADWLEEHAEPLAVERAQFLRAYVRAASTLVAADFPPADKLPQEWLDMIGYPILKGLAQARRGEIKTPILGAARPALRWEAAAVEDEQADIPVGASKLGGYPDLPRGYRWPTGGECHAIYIDDTGGTHRLAGFLAQINLAEVAQTQAAKDLPKSGLLSFFSFQDMENDNPDAVGAKAIYFPEATNLVRTEPGELTDGNETMPAQRLSFFETLDLPTFDGAWSEDLPEAQRRNELLEAIWSRNFDNFMGYMRCTTADDPTPSKESRRLIALRNSSGCRLDLHIDRAALAARDFDKLALVWVEFDP